MHRGLRPTALEFRPAAFLALNEHRMFRPAPRPAALIRRTDAGFKICFSLHDFFFEPHPKPTLKHPVLHQNRPKTKHIDASKIPNVSPIIKTQSNHQKNIKQGINIPLVKSQQPQDETPQHQT